MAKKKRLFIIDAMAMAFRNYHAFASRPLMTSSGLPTSAIFGSAMFIIRLIEKEKPDYLLIATDSKGKTFRHDLYPEYKANRGEMPEDLAEQIPHLFRLFETMKIPMLKQDGMEADDLIGSVVSQYREDDLESYIVSGDKDFMQLIDESTFLYSPKKGGEIKLVDIDGVKEKFGCHPNQVIDILALIGDASDNVPGVRGIGEKGAAKLIDSYSSLDSIYEHLDEITNKRQHTGLSECKDMAYLSQDLVTIKKDIEMTHTLEEFNFEPSQVLVNQDVLNYFQEMEFKGLADRIERSITAAGDQPSKEKQVEEKASEEKEEKPKKGSKKKEPVEFVLVKSDKVNYQLANTRETLDQLLAELKSSEVFSFDTETTGLNIKNDKPIGMSFSTKKETAWYLPIIESHLSGLSKDEVLKEITPFFQSSKTKVAHNLKYDFQMLSNIGIEVTGPIGDTMVAAFILDASDRYSMDHCSDKYLGIQKIPTEALIGKKGETPMADVPLDTLCYYAAEDADCCLQLYQIFMEKLQKTKLMSIYNEVDLPLIPILARMELEGIFVDAKELAVISNSLDKQGKKLEQKIYELAGETFNINSTKQLQVILFEKLKVHEELGIKRLKKTKTGFSTNAAVLEKLSGHPLPQFILDYRTVTKLKNTYVDTLPQLIDHNSNRVHTSFHQTGTQTGRLSSSKPNLQNIPIRSTMGKEIRRAFRAEKSDSVIISADYSQIELRLLAHLSQDANLKKAFFSDADIHKSTAATMFGKNLADVDDTDRSRAKAINYGLIYGMGPQRLARTTGVKLADAKDFIASYFAGFPKIRSYIDQSIETAREAGYSTTISGRRRPIEGLDESGGLAAVNAQNIAVNSPIQGSAADLIKIAMIKIQKQLDESNLTAKMLLQVHDELVFECPKSEADELSEIVRTCMEGAMSLDVPLLVDIGQGRDWLEAH